MQIYLLITPEPKTQGFSGEFVEIEHDIDPIDDFLVNIYENFETEHEITNITFLDNYDNSNQNSKNLY